MGVAQISEDNREFLLKAIKKVSGEVTITGGYCLLIKDLALIFTDFFDGCK